MSNQNLILTMKVDKNGHNFENEGKARVAYIPVNSVINIEGSQNGKNGSKVNTSFTGISFTVHENPLQIEVARDPSTANIYAQDKALGVTATGNAQGAGLDLTNYLTEVTTATGGSADSLDLPAAIKGDVKVVLNNSAVTLQLYPASAEKFSTLAANAALDIPGKSRVHVVCLQDGVWTVAEDKGL